MNKASKNVLRRKHIIYVLNYAIYFNMLFIILYISNPYINHIPNFLGDGYIGFILCIIPIMINKNMSKYSGNKVKDGFKIKENFRVRVCMLILIVDIFWWSMLDNIDIKMVIILVIYQFSAHFVLLFLYTLKIFRTIFYDLEENSNLIYINFDNELLYTYLGKEIIDKETYLYLKKGDYKYEDVQSTPKVYVVLFIKLLLFCIAGIFLATALITIPKILLKIEINSLNSIIVIVILMFEVIIVGYAILKLYMTMKKIKNNLIEFEDNYTLKYFNDTYILNYNKMNKKDQKKVEKFKKSKVSYKLIQGINKGKKAILLNGKFGSGKTHFVDNELDRIYNIKKIQFYESGYKENLFYYMFKILDKKNLGRSVINLIPSISKSILQIVENPILLKYVVIVIIIGMIMPIFTITVGYNISVLSIILCEILIFFFFLSILPYFLVTEKDYSIYYRDLYFNYIENNFDFEKDLIVFEDIDRLAQTNHYDLETIIYYLQRKGVNLLLLGDIENLDNNIENYYEKLFIIEDIEKIYTLEDKKEYILNNLPFFEGKDYIKSKLKINEFEYNQITNKINLKNEYSLDEYEKFLKEKISKNKEYKKFIEEIENKRDLPFRKIVSFVDEEKLYYKDETLLKSFQGWYDNYSKNN